MSIIEYTTIIVPTVTRIAPELIVTYKPHINIKIDNIKLKIQAFEFTALNLTDKSILMNALYIIHIPIIILKTELIAAPHIIVIIPIMQATNPCAKS
ncbi:MAG: hypothetical protein V8R42_01805 [Clostridia bacterium]|jgi:hypothetical protein